MVESCSFTAERRSFSLNTCWPLNSTAVVACAFFSCSFATACCCFCFSSALGTSTAVCAANWLAIAAPEKKTKQIRRITSPKTNQIFHHATVIPAHAEIAEHDKLVVDLETRNRLLLTGAGIDRAHIQIQPIEH